MKREDKQVFDPFLGRSVKNAATDTCSKCGGSIPEEHVPLMLWNESGELMWVYCEQCEKPILLKMLKP
jgi:RNA polymerase-binding transcription factor DksA